MSANDPKQTLWTCNLISECTTGRGLAIWEISLGGIDVA